MDRILTPPKSSQATKPLKAAAPLKAIKPPKSAKTEGLHFLLPGEESWELWRAPSVGLAQLEASLVPQDAADRLKPQSYVAIPMQQAVVFPLWLATTDRSLITEMVWIQLERRGLLTGSKYNTVMDYSVITQEADRCLLSVVVLAGDYPKDYCLLTVNNYSLVADFYALPSDQVILWKELNRHVFVFTSGKELVYAQTVLGSSVDTPLMQEIICAKMQLEAEGVITKLSGITAYGDYKRGELDVLGQNIGAPIFIQSKGQPSVPTKTRTLMPLAVKSAQEQSSKSRRLTQILAIAAAAYFLILSAVLGHYGWLMWQKQSLESEIAKHRDEVKVIRTTALSWEAMELAILPDSYPVEMLFRCTRQLPDDGVRLITFDQVGSRILMTGEAKSTAAAFKFLEDLKKSKDLAGYTWEMPPPKLLPNDSAQFQVEGKRSYAITNSK
ncbi:MAG: hypothetical protein SH807_00440 [Blastochloris sp.]|nr:hypothetical protein [Blastochloris sp.]